MCDCYSKMQEKLREHTGDPNATIERGYGVIGNKMIIVPLVPAILRKKKNDGTLAARATKETVQASHCSFCGEHIVNKDESKDNE